MNANEKQISGDHYKTSIEHWDFVVANDLNYFEGQITKYITRCRKKNGKEDLKKALHFLEKYLEIYDKMNPPKPKIESQAKIDLTMQGFLEKEIPSLLRHPAAHQNDEWQCEGYYGDMSQLYRCRHCRTLVRCHGLEDAYRLHGTCPTKSYVNQDTNAKGQDAVAKA